MKINGKVKSFTFALPFFYKKIGLMKSMKPKKW